MLMFRRVAASTHTGGYLSHEMIDSQALHGAGATPSMSPTVADYNVMERIATFPAPSRAGIGRSTPKVSKSVRKASA